MSSCTDVDLNNSPSFFDITYGYAKTAAGLKNLYAKPLDLAFQMSRQLVKTVSEPFENFSADALGFKNIVACWEVLTKSDWVPMVPKVWNDFQSGKEITTAMQEAGVRTVAMFADWAMALSDLVKYVNTTAKTTFYSGFFQGFFNAASFTFSAICLTEEYYRYNKAATEGILHRFGMEDRKVHNADYVAMYISTAISVAYLTVLFFGADFYIRWTSLAAATAFTIASHYWKEMYIKPLDMAYQKQLKTQ